MRVEFRKPDFQEWDFDLPLDLTHGLGAHFAGMMVGIVANPEEYGGRWSCHIWSTGKEGPRILVQLYLDDSNNPHVEMTMPIEKLVLSEASRMDRAGRERMASYLRGLASKVDAIS